MSDPTLWRFCYRLVRLAGEAPRQDVVWLRAYDYLWARGISCNPVALYRLVGRAITARSTPHGGLTP